MTEPLKNYQIGLYADHNGYSTTVISIDENDLIEIYEDRYNANKVSLNEINESLLILIDKYPRIESIQHNEIVDLNQFLKDNKDKVITKKAVQLDVGKEIFRVKALMNDDKLIIQRNLLQSLQPDLLNFKLDEINHRIYSLLMGTSDLKYKKRYENLMSGTVSRSKLRFQRNQFLKKGWKPFR